jgi:hypothetical protein
MPKELILCHVTYNAPVTNHLQHFLDHLFFSFSRVAVWGLSVDCSSFNGHNLVLRQLRAGSFISQEIK